MENQMYGYIRVSTREQNEDRQVIAMREFGVPDSNMVTDKQSGKDFARPGYRRLLRKLKPGDTLVLKSIDRLGRNYDEILEQWRQGKACRNRCARYASAGHAAGQRSDGYADCRHCASAAVLCRADRAGVYPSAAGRGNRGRQSERCPVRAQAEETSGRVRVLAGRMACRTDFGACGSASARCRAPDFYEVGRTGFFRLLRKSTILCSAR